MIIYVNDLLNSKNKYTQRGSRISIGRSISFLFTNKKLTENDIRQSVLSTIVTIKITYLGKLKEIQ